MKEIPLTRGMFALVDDEDFARCIALGKWQAREGWNTWYASTDSYDKCILLHRFIVGIHELPGNTYRVDHINRNGLDCQKLNLRAVSVSINNHNRVGPSSRNNSGVTGVFWNSKREIWQVEIKWEGRREYLGQFVNFDDAVNARLEREKQLWQTVPRRPS